MKYFIIKRLLLVLPVVFGVVTIVFFMIHIVPGDPIDILLGENARQVDIITLKKQLHLDESIGKQYVRFLMNLIHFDLGESLVTKEPVLSTILKRYPATIELAFCAMIVALCLALPFGIIAAYKKYSLWDHSTMFFSLVGVSMPAFWLGPLLILLFSIKLNLLPVSGKSNFSSIILPSITLGLALCAMLSRMIRSSMLEVINSDYINTARAKGQSEFIVIMKHALKNALIPVITIIGLQFGVLLAGAVITESIFSWPGLGSEIVGALQRRDYPMVQGCIIFISFTYIVINLITDLLYSFVDPRIRLK